MTGADVFLNGTPLSSVCKFSGLTWTTRSPYGDWEASCKLHVPVGFRHPSLVADAVAEVKWGGGVMFLGDAVEPDWGGGELYIRGRIRQGGGYKGWEVVDEAGTDYLRPAIDLPTAIDQAAAGGPTDASVANVTSSGGVTARTALAWKRDTGLYSSDLWDTYPDEPAWIFPDMLDLAQSRGAGTPYMGPTGRLTFAARPTTPEWVVHPDVVDLGEAGGEDRVTRVVVMFLDSTAAGAEKVHFSSDTRFVPYREEFVDARPLEAMTPTEAATIADAILAEHLRPVYTTDIAATPLTVTSYFGQPINPLTLRAGTLGRVHGATHPRLGGSYIDIVAGEVTVSDAETDRPTAVIKPENKPARTFQEVMEKALTDARKAMAA